MSTFRKLLILCATLTFLAVQAHAFQGAAAPSAGSTATAPKVNVVKGTVVETMNVAGYTYLQLENNGQKRWAAIPATQVKVGDQVELAGGMEMNNFQSKSLGRTFETITFSQGLMKR